MRWVLVLALLCSLAVNVWGLVALIDAGISIDHARADSESSARTLAVVLTALNQTWIGRPAEDVQELASVAEHDGFAVNRTPHEIGIEGLSFTLSDGRVSMVSLLTLPAPGGNDRVPVQP